MGSVHWLQHNLEGFYQVLGELVKYSAVFAWRTGPMVGH